MTMDPDEENSGRRGSHCIQVHQSRNKETDANGNTIQRANSLTTESLPEEDEEENEKEEVVEDTPNHLPKPKIPQSATSPSLNLHQKRMSREEEFFTYRRRHSVIHRLVNPSSLLHKPQRARLMTKSGESCITNQNISDKKSKFLVDFFTTLLDLKWRYCILVFALAFLLSWLLFALIYYIICIVHEDHLHMDDPDWKPCHSNVYDFTTAYLLSLETQHTIGYGSRGMEPNCIPSMITLTAQSCIGAFLQCIVTGLVFAKLSRPKRRSQTIMFSEKAVICQRDDELSLLFRVGDMRKTHITGTSIRAVMIKNRLTTEGELIPLCQYPLELLTESSTLGDSYLFLQWPVTVAHCINKDSPLWDVSARELPSQHFEIIVILEGIVSSTSMFTQVRTSYTPSEILWGHRLAPLLTYKSDSGGYKIDHLQFHETILLDKMTLLCARDFERLKGNTAKESKSEETFCSFTTDSDHPIAPKRGALQRLKTGLKQRRHSVVSWLADGNQPCSPDTQSPNSLKSEPELMSSDLDHSNANVA